MATQIHLPSLPFYRTESIDRAGTSAPSSRRRGVRGRLWGALLATMTCGVALPSAVLPDPPKVEAVALDKSGAAWRVSVTLSHADTGWDHYADGWRIEDADGTVLGTRVLAHPHVTEQPFTRSLGGVTLPEGLTTIYVRAKDNLEGWADHTTAVALPAGG